MKNILILFFLLPVFVSGQVNWNQVFGKQRFQQGLGLPSTDTANFRTPVDTSAIVLNRADSTVYFRYKGKWRTLASGGAGTTPNLQQVLTQGATAYNTNLSLIDSIGGFANRTTIDFDLQRSGADNFMTITANSGYRIAKYSNQYARISSLSSGGGNGKSIQIGWENQSDNFMCLSFANSDFSGAHKLKSGSGNGSVITTTIPPITGTLAMSVNNQTADANGNITISTTTDTASLSNRIENKQTGLDILKLMGYGIKAEPYGVTLSQMANQFTFTTNRFYLYPFYWNASDSLRGIAFFSRAALTNVPVNFNGVAIYTLSGGTLTRIFTTANDGAFWNTTINTWSSKALTPTFLAKGLYFIGYQFSGAPAPTIGAGDPLVIASTESPSVPPTAVNANGVKFSTFILNTTSAAPTSIAMSATTAVVNVPYFLFY